MNNNTLNTLIGQTAVKDRLTFYSKAYEKNKVLPHLLFNAPRGIGKSRFAVEFARGLGKGMIEVNGASLTSPTQFVEGVLLEIQGQEITLFIDEVHACAPKVFTLLLSLLNTTNGDNNTNSINWKGEDYYMDFSKITILTATTDTQLMPKPLLDRLTSITFEEYKAVDMGKMVELQCKGKVLFDDGILDKVGTICRGNARNAVLRGKEIASYCDVICNAIDDVVIFDQEAFDGWVNTFGVLPLGLEKTELITLKYIVQSGNEGLTITNLTSKTDMAREPQRQAESFLLRNNLIEIGSIGGKSNRVATQAGKEYISSLSL